MSVGGKKGKSTTTTSPNNINKGQPPAVQEPRLQAAINRQAKIAGGKGVQFATPASATETAPASPRGTPYNLRELPPPAQPVVEVIDFFISPICLFSSISQFNFFDLVYFFPILVYFFCDLICRFFELINVMGLSFD